MAKTDRPANEGNTDTTQGGGSGSGGNAATGGLQKVDTGTLLAGTQANNKMQLMAAIEIISNGQPATVKAPDILADTKTVYITKPVTLGLDKLAAYLAKKGAKLPTEFDDLLKDTEVSLDAFYISTGPKAAMLLMFAIRFKTGLIKALTGDEDLGTLFEVKSASVRVFKCPEDSKKVIEDYVAELTASPAKLTA